MNCKKLATTAIALSALAIVATGQRAQGTTYGEYRAKVVAITEKGLELVGRESASLKVRSIAQNSLVLSSRIIDATMDSAEKRCRDMSQQKIHSLKWHAAVQLRLFRLAAEGSSDELAVSLALLHTSQWVAQLKICPELMPHTNENAGA